jgi:hypothetical protein
VATLGNIAVHFVARDLKKEGTLAIALETHQIKAVLHAKDVRSAEFAWVGNGIIDIAFRSKVREHIALRKEVEHANVRLVKPVIFELLELLLDSPVRCISNLVDILDKKPELETAADEMLAYESESAGYNNNNIADSHVGFQFNGAVAVLY